MALADKIFEATPHPPVDPSEGFLSASFPLPHAFKARRHAV
jgi:hypothetical protein